MPAAASAQRVGLAELVEVRLRLPRHGTNSGAKALSVIGAMLAGDDSSQTSRSERAVDRDPDSTIVTVFGRAKQGAAFGYAKVRG